MQRLAFAVDYARLHQIDHAVPDQLAVNSQVVLVSQAGQHRVGNSADPGLQRCSVGNQRGHILRHAAVHFGERLRMQFQQRVRRFHDRGDAAHMNGRLSMRARHPLIHFGNHCPRAADCVQGAAHFRSQGYVSVIIRRRHLNQHHVQRQIAVSKTNLQCR